MLIVSKGISQAIAHFIDFPPVFIAEIDFLFADDGSGVFHAQENNSAPRLGATSLSWPVSPSLINAELIIVSFV